MLRIVNHQSSLIFKGGRRLFKGNFMLGSIGSSFARFPFEFDSWHTYIVCTKKSSQMGDADSVLGPYQSWHHFKALPSMLHTGHKGDTSWNLETFPKCLGKKPSPPLARSRSRDFPEEEFPASLREVPLVWGVHQKWGSSAMRVDVRQSPNTP